MSDLTGSDQKIHVSTFSNIVPFVMESSPRFRERSMLIIRCETLGGSWARCLHRERE